MRYLPTIRGKQITLSPMPLTNPGFCELYASWLNDPRVRFGIGEPDDGKDYTADSVKDMLRAWRDDPNDMTFLVSDTETSAPIGDVGMKVDNSPFVEPFAETSVMIAPEYSGQGKGYEAMCLMLDYAVSLVHDEEAGRKARVSVAMSGIDGFMASIHSDNIPSLRLYGKLGFTVFDKMAPGSQQSGNKPETMMILSVSEWVNRRERENIEGYESK